MNKIYLFDWGNTLMVDHPDRSGKMCDWPSLKTVDGAADLLARLAITARLYIATGAADSCEADIRRAFERVQLDRYLSGYFCQANLGVSKGTPEFLAKILKQLDAQPGQVTMVGDSYDKDIAPALAVGIEAIWLNPQRVSGQQSTLVRQVSSLRQV